ncbi:MAG: hypothetical protein AAFZ52_05185, partial [Bacteroidota bacterium]
GGSPEQDGRKTRFFGRGNRRQRTRSLVFGGVVLTVMLISNLLLFFYYDRLLDGKTDFLTNGLFRATYAVAIISRLVGLFTVLGTLVQLFLEDFRRPIASFFRGYGSYFYPSLIAIAIVAFVFTKMDQFDGLFIDLVESSGNFFLFSLLLFPASVIIIWFTPAYLMFTDRQFSNRRDSWDILNRISKVKKWPGLYMWTVLHKRFFWQLDELEEDEIPENYLPGVQERKNKQPAAFGRFRTLLAILYILTLTGICADIYFDNQHNPPGYGSWLIYLVGFLALLYVVLVLRQANLAAQAKVTEERTYLSLAEQKGWLAYLQERSKKKRNAAGIIETKDKKEVTVVASPLLFHVGLILTALAFIVFLITFYFVGRDGVPWHTTFGLFLLFLVLSVFAFVWLTLYQPFFQEYTFAGKAWLSDKGMDLLDSVTTQLMLVFIPLLALGSLIFFVVGLFSKDFASSAFVAGLNPLNIYLLLINGLIAWIVLIDRAILLRDRKKHYQAASPNSKKRREWGEVSTANFFWGCAIIGLILASTYLGNSYHEIPYQSAKKSNAVELDTFVKQYLTKGDSTSPILFIAADGGGLKACYWTMLNLYRLDTMGLYDNRVFALSGASGGTIGLSMYNYLKAQDLELPEIRKRIEALGKGNFLSGDFTGLLTRFPVNYLPDLPGWEPFHITDRMESMARAYFRIVGGEKGRYSYEEIRRQPFWHPWSGKSGLPLLIANTARAEDGRLGTITPLRENPLHSSIELTYDLRQKDVISYPDATFLSNRFPIASPAARIPGKGHFLDAGNADNSGISSLYGLLQEMQRRKALPGDTLYHQFFERDVIVLSLRNAMSRYVRDEFAAQLDLLNRYPYQSEFSANTNVAVNTGVSGVPINWDEYFRSDLPRTVLEVDTFLAVNLPFRLREGDVFASLGGELRYPRLKRHRDSLNIIITDHLRNNEFAVMPPLGRLLAQPVREYMVDMTHHPRVDTVFKYLEVYR